MKKLLIIGLLSCLGYLNTQAQVYFASKNFKKKGVTEYISNWGEYTHYWSNVHKQDIQLNFLGNSAYVLPNTKLKYDISYKDKKVYCKHPDGRTQVFTQLPYVYISKGFERKGVTEYLEISKGGTFWYYSSLNKHKRIKLIGLKEKHRITTRYKFPGSAAIYRIIPNGKCGGGFTCTHPDGRKQRFHMYNWKD